MSNITDALPRAAILPTEKEQAVGGLRFDWFMAFLGALFAGGLFLDGWAHYHGRVDDSFFTPWHAVLYSSFGLMAGVLVFTFVRNLRRGTAWRLAAPAGYGLALLGVAIFAAGGGADMVWHELFGVEADTEALISPSHLVLALGMTLMVTSPLRAAWLRPDRSTADGWPTYLPIVLSAAVFLSILSFFTSYAHPFVHPGATRSGLGGHGVSDEVAQSFGIAAMLLQTGVLMGLALLLLRRWQWALPFGSLTLIFGLNAAAMSALHDEFRLILPAVVAGLLADGVRYILKPGDGRVAAVRFFAFATPALYCLAYFAALELTEGIWWSIHLWLGVVVLSGVVGLFLSYLMWPPAGPVEAR
ncbi:MAG: hypothetical protein L0332_18690 [Chloroflexi bacterium]|nr:hypothetical protein [Chloroflexota bacterium]MCI0579970.1 hypothetical protein [Chloroflexota bacterium]MCI0647498.1 hypothetical protein [Chloroflexota bacterium]MCI0728725.1 hypothetical protein [Chloroflexota bacterium]